MRFWNGPQLLIVDLCRYRDYAEKDLAPAMTVKCPRDVGVLARVSLSA